MRTMLLCVLLVGGCGGTGDTTMPDMAGPNFAGTWTGTLVQSTQTCSDGSTGAASSGMTTYQITEAGTQISWPLNCGATFTFNTGPLGSDANQQGVTTCPPATKNGVTVSSSYSNGYMTLNGNALSITLDGKNTVSGTVTGTCTFTISGTLARQ